MKISLHIVLFIIVFGCGENPNENESLNSQLCTCYENQTSNDLDSKLTPCLNEIIDQSQEKIDHLFPELSIDESVQRYSFDAFISMIKDCDAFYIDIVPMFDNYYRFDTSEFKTNLVVQLNDSISSTENTDKQIRLRHQRLKALLELNRFNDAKADFKFLKKENESGAYLASAWMNYKMKNKEKALKDIETAMKIENNPSWKIFEEIIKKTDNIN